MRRFLRGLGLILGGFAVLAAAAVVLVYVLSGRLLGRTYPLPEEPPLQVPSNSAAVARGRHLATSVATCVLCHGEDLGGRVYADAGPLGVIVGPNLTRGRGGVGAAFAEADWERHPARRPARRHLAHRHAERGLRPPHRRRPRALVAFLRQAPPVDRALPQTHFRLLGRAFLAAGRLPLLVAAKTPRLDHAAAVTPGPTAAYGRYLAAIGGCHGCHGHGLSGGRVAGPPDLPPASNLTPAGLSRWTEADFVRALREGRRPNGDTLDAFMPWRVLGRMTDAELHALWLYLRSVPPKPFGNK